LLSAHMLSQKLAFAPPIDTMGKPEYSVQLNFSARITS
jgi:hypothetical protein